jgi:hypothetical protein
LCTLLFITAISYAVVSGRDKLPSFILFSGIFLAFTYLTFTYIVLSYHI